MGMAMAISPFAVPPIVAIWTPATSCARTFDEIPPFVPIGLWPIRFANPNNSVAEPVLRFEISSLRYYSTNHGLRSLTTHDSDYGL